MNDEIELVTYKKWNGKLSIERAYLTSPIEQLSALNQDQWDVFDGVFARLTNLKVVFDNAISKQAQALNVVFEAGLIFNGRCFRTASLSYN